MLEGDKIKVAQGENPCYLLLNQANRHGLIAGASGTGKTVTMKVLAEGFAQAGVPVFMADVKGDVTGMAQPGDDAEKVRERAAALGADGWEPRGCDVRLWDMLDDAGIPVRITISDMGPELLARLLGLTDVQRGVLAIAFRLADDNGMLLIDLKDLRAMLGYLSEHASEVETLYGRVSSQSVGAIQRALLTLEDAGGDIFFGEPALDITDWLVVGEAGQGTVNILNAAKLMASPQVYAMFLLWMLSEIYELLPEAGDLPKPKLVFFFDEAHLLFDDMPKELTDKIVQTVKLIRSKGVGVYFVSQSPADIPDELTQRVQELAVATFRALNCLGVARIDFLNDRESGELWVNEINTIPGSLAFYLWEAAGVPFSAMLDRMIEAAFKRQREREALTFSYDVNLLAGVSLGGAKSSAGCK